MKKLVSVIIPCYNQARFLRAAVDSVHHQTYRNFEVIIVDDGSTDDTAAVAADIRDSRVKYIYQVNRGLAGARNAGLRLAQGEYVAFLDADDVFLPHKLEVQVAALDQHPAWGLVSGGWAYLTNAAHPVEARPWEWAPHLDLASWLLGCPTIPCGVLARRQWVEAVGGFDEQLRRAEGAEDWDLWLRLAYAGCQMEWTQDIVCLYRLHDANMTRNEARQKAAHIAVLDKFFTAHGDDGTVVQHKNLAYVATYLHGARREYAVGQIQEAQDDLRRAAELDPSLLTDRRQHVFDVLVSYCAHPYAADASQYIQLVFDNLPGEFESLRRQRAEALAAGYMVIFYSARQRGDWRAVAESFAHAVYHNPRWLRNRGAVKMWLTGLASYARVGTHRLPTGKGAKDLAGAPP